MKLHALELTGFGPFRETQRVDFDAFDGDGLFLISGRTGAGKSSILDGVSFALYGSVPRYDGGEKRLRSDHCYLTDPTEVRLEFTIGDTRWRITRAPEYDRPAKRGGGLTAEPARAELEELVGGVWVGRAARPRDVGVAMDELLGLNAQQFQQVILLAQNKFSRFLLASGEERQTLLRTLFGTRRFERYRDDLEQRRRDAQKQLDTSTEHARTLLDVAESLVREHALGGDDTAPAPAEADVAGRRDALVAALQRAEYRVEQAKVARAHADAALTSATETHANLVAQAARGRERIELRARLAELEAMAPRLADVRARLERARTAEALRAPLETADRAQAALAAAQDAVDAALVAWTTGGGEASADIAVRLDELTVELARFADAAAQERDLDALERSADEKARALAEADAALVACDAVLGRLPADRGALDEATNVARATAARRDDLHRALGELQARRDAAREAAVLAETAERADREHAGASAAAATAAVAVSDLLQRRLAGYAGELSAALVAGEACAVCGSTEHPHPAAASPEPITDDDLARAERARDETAGAASAAAEAARAARERLADANSRAGGFDEASLSASLDLAQSEAEAADAAWNELQRLEARRADLDELTARTQRERVSLEAQATAHRAEHAAIAADIARSAGIVAAARGEFATVAARIAAAESERALALTLAEARAHHAERSRALADANADAAARIAASGVGDIAGARAALLSHDEQARLDDELSAHAAAFAATRSRLLELELDAAGDDVTDAAVTASAEALEAADRERASAIAAQRDAESTAARLRKLALDADAAYAAVAEVADDAASVTRLADTVAGRAPNTMKMDLETFVLAAELEEIVAAASIRLSEMSSGRYTLHHSDARAARGRASGLGIEVLDAHTGRLRAPQSLSGGETFLASLALALGLGEVVTSRAGGIRLDTLFVDEGFGSLDPETLELAMRTLDELRAGGRTVGVISHVEAMKEQLPAQLVVEATAQGPSVIRQDVAQPL
ncbi:MAG: ATPase [Microbacterium sp.]|nr:MAG: ATPase [Microbacterium sp.]